MKQNYRIKKGARLKVPNVQAVGEAIEEIERRNGSVTPARVVKAARRRTSPLHPIFDWDDKTAAESYRIEQAQILMRSIVVDVVVRPGEAKTTTRAFVSIETSNGDCGYAYQPVSMVMDDSDLRAEYLEQARAELRAWCAKWRVLFPKDLARVLRAADSLD